MPFPQALLFPSALALLLSHSWIKILWTHFPQTLFIYLTFMDPCIILQIL